MNHSPELFPIYGWETEAPTWKKVNPIVPLRQLAYDVDDNKFKVGDGVHRWRDLGYLLFDSVGGDIQLQLDTINGNIETLQSTAQSQGSSIKNLQDLIALTVTTYDFSTYQTAVSGQFSSINTKLTNDETSITALQNEIALTVTKNYVDEQLDNRAKVPVILTNETLSFSCGTGDESATPIAFYDGSPIQINITGPNTVAMTVAGFQSQSLTVAQCEAKYNTPIQFETGAIVNPAYTDTDGTRTSTLSIQAAIGQGDYLTYNGKQAYLNGVRVVTTGQLLAYTGGTIKVSNTGLPFTEKLSYAMDAYGDVISTNMSYTQASISLLSDNIDLKVNRNGVIGDINLSPEALKIHAAKLELDGYATFTNLSTAGQTVINGANIMTDTVTANKLTTSGSSVVGTIGSWTGKFDPSDSGNVTLSGFILRTADQTKDLYRILTGKYGDDGQLASFISTSGHTRYQSMLPNDDGSQYNYTGSSLTLFDEVELIARSKSGPYGWINMTNAGGMNAAVIAVSSASGAAALTVSAKDGVGCSNGKTDDILLEGGSAYANVWLHFKNGIYTGWNLSS